MWWGGFSEEAWSYNGETYVSLNPHVVGRFFREWVILRRWSVIGVLIPMWWGGFSERKGLDYYVTFDYVLIPMWWGGFSEAIKVKYLRDICVLIPMWWGGFSESGGLFSLLNSNA